MIKKCKHGWEIKEENKLPYKKTLNRISVCPKCALKSSLNEMSFELDENEMKKLKEKLFQLKILKIRYKM